LVEHARGVAVDLPARPLEVLLPEPEPGLSHQYRVANDDIALRVVEERVLVEVRRANRKPGVVADRRLRVDVDRVAAGTGLEERATEEAGGVVALLVGVDQDADLPATVVGAVVRLGGEQRDDPEVVARRSAQLLGEHQDDLWRPEELTLEV